MGVSGLTYSQYLYGITNPDALNYMLKLENMVNTGQISQAEFASQVQTITGKAVTPVRAYNGDVIGYNLSENVTVSNPNTINSNASTVSRGITARPVTTTVNTGGKAIMQGLRNVGGKIAFGSALVGTAAMCVSAGITLGKAIDGTLYNLNPNFFDSNNLGALNPERWSALTAGDDSIGAKLLNVLFGFDSNGNVQAYMDENAFAYFASYMQQQGAFAESYNYEYSGAENLPSWGNFEYPVKALPEGTYLAKLGRDLVYYQSDSDDTKYFVIRVGNDSGMLIPCTKNAGKYCQEYFENGSPFKRGAISDSFTFDNKTVYYTTMRTIGYNGSSPEIQYVFNTASDLGSCAASMAFIIQYGTVSAAVQGITTQPNATTPTGLTGNPDNDLALLRNQYPDMWNNAINYPVIQPDGTVKNYTYVPVSLPENFTRTGTQPTSGSASQANPIVNPSTAPSELIDTITDILINPYPETETDIENPNPPENPTDTGDGSSPVPVVPIGSASSMWKIYHPTQAQVDSFGGWLWSSAFIDQILKIFNNPMEAIIGLHKVYATPIDAGNTTIKVGYLDSNVPSAYIEQQYITVDCGSVNINELFGNVFDYSPFTTINLYLPFIGIVQLNVSDVMRSTVSIKYGVDVLTGACLAMVSVSRDTNDSILYQYSGNCAVQYPISSGSYMGIVSSIISIAGGVAATVATGGGAAPLVLGAAGAALNAHTNVQHSGSFSGNAGAMGGKIPYLIISRPQTKLNSDYSEMEGTPTNHYISVGECVGYVKARTVHVININATDTELDEIQSLLINGIII